VRKARGRPKAHQHDEIGPIHDLGKVGGQESDRNQPLVNAARLDAAASAQLVKTLGVARMQPPCPALEYRDRPDAHAQSL
jgi:hypothetical protein